MNFSTGITSGDELHGTTSMSSKGNCLTETNLGSTVDVHRFVSSSRKFVVDLSEVYSLVGITSI